VVISKTLIAVRTDKIRIIIIILIVIIVVNIKNNNNYDSNVTSVTCMYCNKIGNGIASCYSKQRDENNNIHHTGNGQVSNGNGIRSINQITAVTEEMSTMFYHRISKIK